jgi:hypothetical protein
VRQQRLRDDNVKRARKLIADNKSIGYLSILLSPTGGRAEEPISASLTSLRFFFDGKAQSPGAYEQPVRRYPSRSTVAAWLRRQHEPGNLVASP